MSDEQGTEAMEERARRDEGDELRTIGFRLREVQRLLAVRVEQENRRLEAEGLEPVTEPRFRDPEKRVDESDEE